MCRVSLKHLAGELPPEPVNFQPNDMLPGVFRSVCTSSPLLQHVHPPPTLQRVVDPGQRGSDLL